MSIGKFHFISCEWATTFCVGTSTLSRQDRLLPSPDRWQTPLDKWYLQGLQKLKVSRLWGPSQPVFGKTKDLEITFIRYCIGSKKMCLLYLLETIRRLSQSSLLRISSWRILKANFARNIRAQTSAWEPATAANRRLLWCSRPGRPFSRIPLTSPPPRPAPGSR